MEQLLLVNPKSRKKPRTAAQKAATRKMIAANRSKHRRTKNRTQNVPGYYPNPAPARKRRRNPINLSAVKRRRRRNPAVLGGMGDMLVKGLQGGVGAVAVDAAVGFLPLPVALKTGWARHGVRALGAVLLGQFGSRFIGPMARNMAAGAMAVTMRDVVAEVAVGAGLNLNGMAGLQYYAPAQSFAPRAALSNRMAGIDEYVDYGVNAGMSEYVDSGY